jgi:hypothetical protein
VQFRNVWAGAGAEVLPKEARTVRSLVLFGASVGRGCALESQAQLAASDADNRVVISD